MYSHVKKSILFLLITAIIIVGQARADEIAEQGRTILNQYKDSVIKVQLVLKQTVSFPGSPSQEMESKVESTGTVISEDGLTIVSLTEVDPSAMIAAMGQMDGIKMDTEVQDVKMLMSDGTEIASEIILRDIELDLAFVRPIKKQDSPFSFVNLKDSATPLQLDPVIAVNQLGKVARRAHSISVERIDAIVNKPRTFFIPGKDPSNSGLGAPVFTLEGKIIGIFLIRAIKETGGGSMFGRQDNITAIILPAIDILDAAEQAPPFK